MMRGGIQKGTTAFDYHSRLLDTNVRECSHLVSEQVEKDFDFVSGMTSSEFYGKDLSKETTGIKPDGGIFINKKTGKAVVFEAKKQGDRGNACERLGFSLFKLSQKYGNDGYKYVVFCSGEGVNFGNTFYRCFNSILKSISTDKKWDVVYDSGPSFIGCEEGFSQEEITNIMMDSLYE